MQNVNYTSRHLVQLKTHGVQWELVPAFEPILAGLLVSSAKEIKNTPTRWVGQVDFGGKSYYWKRSIFSQPFKSFIHYFKGSRPRHEWRIARAATERGAPVVPHLAYGETWSWRGLIKAELITAAADGFVALSEIPQLNSANIQRGLGRFLRHLHDGGVALRDLHPKNLLYSPATEEFCLIDLETASVETQIGDRMRVEHLARLYSRLPLSSEFFDAYGHNASVRAEDVARQAPLLRRKRCLKKNNDFRPVVEGGMSWWVRTEFLNDNLKRMLRAPEELLARDAKILKAGSGATIGCANGLVLKWYQSHKLGRVLKDFVRSSRARRAYLKAYHLEISGIPTPRPVAVASKRKLGLFASSFFIMEEIPCAVQLRTWRGDKRQAIRDVANLIAKLHEAGFSHRDLKETNILFDPQGKPHLIDLEGLRYVGQVTDERAAADFVRLAKGALGLRNVYRSDRVKFLQDYCRCRGKGNWRTYWKAVEKGLLRRGVISRKPTSRAA